MVRGENLLGFLRHAEAAGIGECPRLSIGVRNEDHGNCRLANESLGESLALGPVVYLGRVDVSERSEGSYQKLVVLCRRLVHFWLG